MFRLLLGSDALRDLFLRSSREHAFRVIFRIPTGSGSGVFLFNQEPFVALAALGAYNRKIAVDLFAGNLKLEIATRQLFFRRGVA